MFQLSTHQRLEHGHWSDAWSICSTRELLSMYVCHQPTKITTPPKQLDIYILFGVAEHVENASNVHPIVLYINQGYNLFALI